MPMLKGCPFCGAEPRLSSRPTADFDDHRWVAFTACYCAGYSATAHKMGYGNTQQEAIDAVIVLWNNRPLELAEYEVDTPLQSNAT